MTRAETRRWIQAAADLGVNTIRIYTVQKPEFYEELRRYNLLNPEQPIFLLQGAWIKEPEGPEPDYLSEESDTWFKDELTKAVDVTYGDRTIPWGTPERPMNYGRAFGTYTADVSPWLLGWLVGREIEPLTMDISEAKHPEVTEYIGRYMSIVDGGPMETWITEHLDYLLQYEKEHHGRLHTIGFSNWPTLDPIHHFTEPAFPTSVEDTWSVDMTKVIIDEEAYSWGMFMSFHAYPYYPNFIIYQTDYQVDDGEGINGYIAYLEDLERYYADYPVIISEIGIPSSQGNAHTTISGLNHGGFDEVGQGKAVNRTLRNVVDAGLDGYCIFSMVDEWFKAAWVVDRIEVPAGRRRMWHNPMSPEQNFGLIALRAGPEGSYHWIDGLDDDWASGEIDRAADPSSVRVPTDEQDPARNIVEVEVSHDEAYLHVLLRLQDLDPDGNGRVEWDRVDYVLAFDVIDPERGDGRLDPEGRLQVERRVEFQMIIDSEQEVWMMVDKPFDLFGQWHGVREDWQRYRTVRNDDGIFHLMRTITNWEYVYDGKALGPILVDEIGRVPTGHESERSTTDFWYDVGSNTIEVRVPWSLLQVTDPSQRFVVDDHESGQRTPEVSTTDGIAVMAASLSGSGEAEQAVADTLPRAAEVGPGQYKIPAEGVAFHTWDGWEEPTHHEYRKASFDIVRQGIPEAEARWRALQTGR